MAVSDPVLPKTVALWTRSDSPKLVTAKNIFDYMNGAGELYLGYRFDRLHVYEYRADSQKGILVELYFMKTPDDAFGLLSLDWGGDPVHMITDLPAGKTPGFAWPRALYGQGLLRLWTENIYARVMAIQETPESRAAVLSIGKAIVKDRKELPVPSFVDGFKDLLSQGWSLRRDRLSFFRTHLVMNSLYYLSHQNILDLDLACEAASVLYEKKDIPGKKIRIQSILVRYPDSNRAKQALSHFHEVYLADRPLPSKTGPSGEIRGAFSIEDGWMAYARREKIVVFVFECPDEKTATSIVDQIF